MRSSINGGRLMEKETQQSESFIFWGHSQSVTLPSQTFGTATVIGDTIYYNETTSGGGTLSGTCTRYMEVNSQNIVISGYSQGNNCCVLAIGPTCGPLAKN